MSDGCTGRPARLAQARPSLTARTALGRPAIQAFVEDAGWRVTQRITGRDLGMPRSRSEWEFVVAASRRAS